MQSSLNAKSIEDRVRGYLSIISENCKGKCKMT